MELGYQLQQEEPLVRKITVPILNGNPYVDQVLFKLYKNDIVKGVLAVITDSGESFASIQKEGMAGDIYYLENGTVNHFSIESDGTTNAPNFFVNASCIDICTMACGAGWGAYLGGCIEGCMVSGPAYGWCLALCAALVGVGCAYGCDGVCAIAGL